MTKLQLLKATTDRKSLAILLGFKPKALSYILYKKPPGLKYFPFQIPKRSGGMRTIQAPSEDLKRLQTRLADLLQDCISDINEGRKISGAISHGFRRKRSIITNARCHRGKKFVFNIDIKEFFDSINFGRVRGFFIKNKNFDLNPDVATVIAQIACHDNALPQGSPCSPVVSNLVAHILDIRLAKLAQKYGCDYSRYADDLTFSTNKSKFPRGIACTGDAPPHEWEPGSELAKIIKNSGFAINPSKTRMQYHQSRQDVTGLVVNSKVNVKTEYEKVARAMAHTVFKTGSFYAVKHKLDASGNLIEEQVPGTLQQLQGIMSFIDNVKRSNWSESNPRPKERVGYERLYRDILFYKDFYASDLPILLFEGKTDNIYIKCALKDLYKDFPQLAEKSGNSLSFKIRFMSYTNVTSRMLDLSGGTGELNKLVSVYGREWNRFTTGHKGQPVILFVDNDKGSEGLFNSVKNTTKKTVTGQEPFLFVGQNLYVVPTPRTKAGGDTMIEDFFPKSVREKKLGTKKFNPGKTFDSKTEYGKYLFAEKIVRQQQNNINFGRFKPLLARIVMAIGDYASKADGQA